MKRQFRKTGEIIEVISFSSSSYNRSTFDYISYIDSNGVEHYEEHNLNYYWDTKEVIDKDSKENFDWTCFRNNTAAMMLQSLIESETSWSQRLIDDVFYSKLAKHSINLTDKLIEELKK